MTKTPKPVGRPRKDGSPPQRRSYRIPVGPASVPYSEEVGKRVAAHVAAGKWLKEIAPLVGVPEVDLFKWFRDEVDFQKRFTTAREMSAYALESEAIELLRQIVANPKADNLALKKAEALAVQFRWSAERRNPREFGYRPATTAPVQVSFVTNLNLDGTTPLEAIPSPRPGGYEFHVTADQRERLKALRNLPPDLLLERDKAELAEFADVRTGDEPSPPSQEFKMIAHVPQEEETGRKGRKANG